MLFISKNSSFQLMRILRCWLSASFFKAGCKLSVKMEFPRSCSYQGDRGIYYTCTVLGRNLAQENMSWEKPVILASLFPKFWKTLTALDQKFGHPCVWNITGTSSSLWMWMRRSWMVVSYSLILVSWRKGISPSNFRRDLQNRMTS